MLRRISVITLVLVLVGCTVPTPVALGPTLTMTAPTHTSSPTITPPAWPTPIGVDDFLPAPLYYISSRKEENAHQCPMPHLIRIERDGRTRTVIGPCFAYAVNGFDVSRMDGSIVLAAEGALWRLAADGKNAKRLVESLPDPELASQDMFEIQSPAWSPDGTQIAYADGGIRILDTASGNVRDVIKNKCYPTDQLGTGTKPCFYGDWFLAPRWSPDGKALLIYEQTADYPVQEVFIPEKDEKPHTIPGTLGITGSDEITWSRDGTALLFDYWWPANVAPITFTSPAFVRVAWKDFEIQPLWPHGDRADPIYASSGNNPWQVRYPFETPDGRILFFQAEPCDTGSCYKYDLVEGRLGPNGFNMRLLRRDAKLPGAEAVWHDSGEYIAFFTSPSRCYVGVMKVSTGETFLLAEEDRCQALSVWGKP